VNNCRVRRRWIVRGSSRDIHDDILETVFLNRSPTGLDQRRRGVHLCARRFFRHINRLHPGRCPFIGHLAADGAAGRFGQRRSRSCQHHRSCQYCVLHTHPKPPSQSGNRKPVRDSLRTRCSCLPLSERFTICSAFLCAQPQGQLGGFLSLYCKVAQIMHQGPTRLSGF